MKKIAVIGVIALLFTGCAQKASSVQGAYISPLRYEGKSCRQLKNEVIRVNERVVELSGQQDSAAAKDAVAVGIAIIFWPSLFYLAADNEVKDELSRLKGQYETIREVALDKQCSWAEKLKIQ